MPTSYSIPVYKISLVRDDIRQGKSREQSRVFFEDCITIKGARHDERP
jgi:hypothetical protein